MKEDALRKRGNALEETHFRRVEAERRRRAQADEAEARVRAELRAKLALEDEDLVAHLVGLGIHAGIASAFEALPLAEVAWADGEVEADERRIVLALAMRHGLEPGCPAHAQLELWLTKRPEPELLEAWHRFAAGRRHLPQAAADARRLLDDVRAVAMASGGLFGIRPVSGSERVVIARISEVLSCAASEHN